MFNLKPRVPLQLRPHGTTVLLLHSIILSLLFLAALTAKIIAVPSEAQGLSVPFTEELPTPTPAVLFTRAPAPQASPDTLSPDVVNAESQNPDPIEQKQSIKSYIYELFGQNGSTAYAISLAEGKAKKRYKGELVYDVTAVRKTDRELSVGIFQVNLRSKYARVHWNRIPGQTEEEKIIWLQNPFNNTLVAHWIYSTHGNFEAWTAYTAGTYLAYAK